MNKENILKIGVPIAALAVLLFLAQAKIPDGNSKPITEEKPREFFLEWSKAGDALWAPRDSHASFVFKNKIWVIGGINGNGLAKNGQINYWDAPHYNDIWNSEDGINWDRVESENIWAPRRSMTIVEFGGRLLMFGGWSPVTGYSKDLWESRDGINWVKAESKLPWEAREGQIAEILNGRLYVMGGVNYDKRRAFNDVWYTEDGEHWSLVVDPAPWSGRWDFALAEQEGKLFLFGGMNLRDDEFNDVWVTEDGLNWSLVTSNAPWATRQGHSAIVLSGKIWMFGRLNDKDHPGPNDMWSTQDGINWKYEGELPWDGREDFSSNLFKKRIIVMGGMANDWTWRNDIWMAELKSR